MVQKPARLIIAMLAMIAATAPASFASAKEYRGRAHIVDGDTIEIGLLRIRFFGIDAPESRQLCKDALGVSYACGRRSTAYLRKLIGEQVVTCKDRGPAANNRRRGWCKVGRLDLQKAMVAAGHARYFRLHSERYKPEHARARAAKIGFWQGYHRRPGAVRKCRRDGEGNIQSCSFK